MEMDSEYAKRIVLAVVTNLNTRFVFAPLRSEAFGDIRGTIKSDHMELFPTWGEVEVNALEVELLGYRNRIPDHIQVGHLFRNASEAQVFTELIPSSSNTPFELPRLKLAGARNLHSVPEHELRQNSEEKLTPLPLETRGLVEGHVLPDLGASSYSNLGKSVSERGKGEGRLGRGCDPVSVERQLRNKKRGIDEPENVGEMQQAAAADCAAVEVVGSLTKKCRIDINRGLPVLEHNETETLTSKSADKDAVAKSVPVTDARLKPGSADGPTSRPLVAKNGQEEEAALLASDLTKRDVVVKSAVALDVRDESNKRNGSGGSSIQSDQPVVVEKLQPEAGLASVRPVAKLQPGAGLASVKPVEKLQPGAGLASVKAMADSVPKTLMAWTSKRNSSSAVLSNNGGGQLGLSGTEKLRQEPSLVASQPENVEVGKKVTVADTSSSGSESEGKSVPLKRTIKRGKQADKVEVVGPASKPENVEIGKKVMLANTSSGSSSSDSEAESVPLKRSIKRGKQADKVEVVGLATPEKRVPSGGGLQNLNVTSKRGSLEIENKSLNSKRRGTGGLYSGTTSGGSTGETGGQKSEKPSKKSVSLHVKEEHISSDSDGNNGESDSGEGSKSGRRGESSAGKDSDQTTSDGDSSLQSSDGSESEDLESSSDESEGSEEMPQRGRKLDFTPKDRIGGARSNGRRSLGGVVDLKYQHFLDSPDGFDQLISLSQQKLKEIPGSQQSLAELEDSIAPVSLADDSLSIDVVPDTQVPEQDFYALEPVEDKNKESSRSVKESVVGSRSAGQQGLLPGEAVEDIAGEGENWQSTGPPSSVKNGTGGQLSVELILTGTSTTDKVPEPAQKELLPQPKSEDSQQIRAAVQLARMSLAKGVTSVVVSSPSKKKSRRNQGVSSLENQGVLNIQELRVERVAEVQSNQDRDAPVKDAAGISLNDAVDDQTPLEANRLPTPIPNVGVGEDLGNVLLALEGEETLKAGSQTDARLAAQAPAAEANLGMPKQHGKRRHRAFQESGTQVPPEHKSRGDVNRPEEDPSRGDVGLPANTGDDEPSKEEHSGKNASFEYRDLRNKGSGAAPTSSAAAVEKKRREKGLKSLGSSKKVANGAAEDDKHAELPKGDTDERKRPDPAHSSLVNNKGTADREGQQTAFGDGESPSVIIQRTLAELRLPNVGKTKKKKDRSESAVIAVANRNDLPVEANQNDSEEVGKSQPEEDTNHGIQDQSVPASKREPNDAGAEKDKAAPAGSPGNAVEHSNGAPGQKKRRERRRDVAVSDKSLHSVQSDTEEADAVEEGNEDEHLVPNEDTNAAADKESPIVVVTAQKKSHKKGGGRAAANPSNKVRDLETSLVDQSTKRTPNSGRKVGSNEEAHVSQLSAGKKKEEAHVSQLSAGKKKEEAHVSQLSAGKKKEEAHVSQLSAGKKKEEAHVSQLSAPKKKGEEEEERPAGGDVPALGKAPRITTLGIGGAKAAPSSLGEKMKKKWDKLKKPQKQSEPDVAEEMEQLDDPAVAEVPVPVNGLRTEGADNEEEDVSLKKKKKRDRSLDPATEAGNSEAVESIEAAPQVASADDENPQQESSPEIIKRPAPKDNNGQTVKERARKRKLEESSLKEDTLPSQKKKVGGLKKGEVSSPSEKPRNAAKKQQVTPPSSRRRQGNNTTKSSEGGRGESTEKDRKRTAGGRFHVDGVNPEDKARCPHGCGREFSGKTSAYFRHQKSCALKTSFGRE